MYIDIRIDMSRACVWRGSSKKTEGIDVLSQTATFKDLALSGSLVGLSTTLAPYGGGIAGYEYRKDLWAERFFFAFSLGASPTAKRQGANTDPNVPKRAYC